ncbi:MAG: CAT RNA binding domain-containing protein [Merdibacter sp.]
MRVIKKLNNNAVICVDNNGNQLIALGNGIGFPKTPYTLNDLSKIRKTFYGVNAKYYGLLNEIPDVIFTISAKLVDVAKTKIARELNPNIVFTLADHIKFAYDRYQKE